LWRPADESWNTSEELQGLLTRHKNLLYGVKCYIPHSKGSGITSSAQPDKLWRLAHQSWNTSEELWKLAHQSWNTSEELWRLADQSWNASEELWRLAHLSWNRSEELWMLADQSIIFAEKLWIGWRAPAVRDLSKRSLISHTSSDFRIR